MKIVIVSNSSSGLYKFRGELMEELAERYEVVILVPKGDFIEEMEAMGCKFKFMKVDRHGTNPLSELKLISEYKKEIQFLKKQQHSLQGKSKFILLKN